jgi:putative DNA primase/helicase
VFCGAMRFGTAGEVMIAIRGGTVIIPAKEGDEIRFVETDSEQGFTIALPVNYNPNAAPTTFAHVLTEAVPDPGERELFLDVLATALIPDCRYEIALVAIGETGAGKSTVASPLPDIFGDACSFLSLADLCHPQGYKVSGLNHRALNIGTELDVLEFDDSGLFKQLVSGETITVRAIYGRPFEMKSHATMLFLANSLPKFKHGTQAEARRLGFVRFNHKPAKPDVTLKARVAADAEGLFAELVRRAQELLAGRAITRPGKWGRETAERFAVTNDPVGEFVARYCNLGSNLTCEKEHLYNAFEEFRDQFGISDKLDGKWFFRTLYDRFPEVKQRKVRTCDGRTRIIEGINLK